MTHATMTTTITDDIYQIGFEMLQNAIDQGMSLDRLRWECGLDALGRILSRSISQETYLERVGKSRISHEDRLRGVWEFLRLPLEVRPELGGKLRLLQEVETRHVGEQTGR